MIWQFREKVSWGLVCIIHHFKATSIVLSSTTKKITWSISPALPNPHEAVVWNSEHLFLTQLRSWYSLRSSWRSMHHVPRRPPSILLHKYYQEHENNPASATKVKGKQISLNLCTFFSVSWWVVVWLFWCKHEFVVPFY